MDKTKRDSEARNDNGSQLRKELNQAGKILQSLASKVDGIERSLEDSKTALANESQLRSQMQSLETKIYEIEESRRRETEAYGTSMLRLNEDFLGRLNDAKQACKSQLQEEKNRLTAAEKVLRSELVSERAKNKSLEASDGSARRELQNRVKEAENKLKDKETSMSHEIEKLRAQFDKLGGENKALNKELGDQQVILKGREKEKERLANKLAAIEAFPTVSLEKIQHTLDELQHKLQSFCHRCVDEADVLPSGSPVPESLQRENLPLYYSIESSTGYDFISALIQHSVSTAMTEQIFVSAPLSCKEMNAVADSLHRINPSHEAIWRLMTVTGILRDPEILSEFRDQVSDIADSLLQSWKLFRNYESTHRLRDELTAILYDAFLLWLELLSVQDKIHVSHSGARSYFESGPSETASEVVKVPGDFAPPEAAFVLCLFPAFLRISTTERTMQPTLVYKGFAIYQDSLVLVQAIKESQAIRSPKVNNKRFSKVESTSSA